MKINIFPIVSSLHEQSQINKETLNLIKQLESLSNHQFSLVGIDDFYNADLSLILIQSGGSEQIILENINKLKSPFYLLTYGTNNSLAASLEILSYIKDNSLEGEILHGSVEYILSRINSLNKRKDKYRYGVIGKPSDWLIASNVDYTLASKLHGIELIDIDIQELITLYNDVDFFMDNSFDYDKKEIDKALKLYHCINVIKEKYRLDGLTIRCFDLLDTIKTTSCLAFSLLNKEKVVSTCEGDIVSMISMHTLKKVCNQVGFQANPSRINVIEKTMVLAHCTLPMDMCESYSLNTHYESSIGVAVKGNLKESKVTIFKLSRNLKDYYVTTGTIIENLNESNLCRTQIKIKIDNDIEYFLTRPYGNHHIIVYGDVKDKIIDYMNKIK